ncbi:MAG: RNA polymerase sigma factor [Kiritimatiellia bacterium]
MTEDTRSLLRRAKDGDMDAFTALLEPLRPFSFSAACRLVGPNDAEDMVMEAFLKAWQSLEKFRGGSALRTWLYRILHNCCVDFLRSRRSGGGPETTGTDADGLARRPDESAPGPDRQAEGKDTAHYVKKALGRLPEEQRTVLELRYSEDLSYGDIAALTGVSAGTVMSRLFYAKRRLKSLVEGEL